MPGSRRLAEGTVALGRRPWVESFAVPDPNLYAARALARSGLAERAVETVVASGRSPLVGCELAAAGPHAVLAAAAAEPVGRVTLVVDACTSGHLAAMVVRSGAVG